MWKLVDRVLDRVAEVRSAVFALRLLLGGIGCALIGIWWTIDGVSNGFVNEVIGGLVWKGPFAGIGRSGGCDPGVSNAH